MANIRELKRMRNNEKVKAYVTKILDDCKAQNFTIADMIDLAEIIPTKINEAIISAEEKTIFNVFPQ